MAPSSTKGAVTRLLRNAAINVTVFQFPCSTFWMSRSPCGARPYRRVIVVDTLVSSMNTSLLGSSLFCRRCNALRAAATSGRSCSAARKLFFKGQLQMMQKPRDRRLSDRDLFLRQSIFEFGQRDVRLLRYQLPHQILVRRQREIFIAAEFGRVDAARLPVKLEEADDRADADPALLRGFRDRGPALDRLDHTPTQIRRIWLRHSCRPPPSRKLESYSRRYGNPRFSLSGKRSKQWRKRSSLRSPFHARADQPVLHHPGIQECPDELQQPLVLDTFGDLAHQLVMIDPIEEFFQIKINHPTVACSDILLRLSHGVTRGSTWSEPIAVLGECRVPLLLQNLHHRLLNKAIQHGWDAKLSHPSSIRLRDFHPSHRFRFVGPVQQLLPSGRPVLLQIVAELIDRHPVDTRATFVALHLPQCFLQVCSFTN